MVIASRSWAAGPSRSLTGSLGGPCFRMVSRRLLRTHPCKFYGRRSVLWARFRNIETGAMVFFMNHHGPLPVNSGGLCGGRATAYNILRVAGYFAHPGDDVVLVGDFNADPTSMTIKELSNHLGRAYTGKSFNGVDNFFTSCGRLAHVQNLGTGGSDHDALRATFDFGHATPSFSIV